MLKTIFFEVVVIGAGMGISQRLLDYPDVVKPSERRGCL